MKFQCAEHVARIVKRINAYIVGRCHLEEPEYVVLKWIFGFRERRGILTFENVLNTMNSDRTHNCYATLLAWNTSDTHIRSKFVDFR